MLEVTLTSPPALEPEARVLAQTYGLAYSPEPGGELVLIWTGERLELSELTTRTKPLYVDFAAGAPARRAAARGLEPLARAAGLKGGHRPYVVDATAGLGQDALVLAAAGCEVTLFERSPVVAALLADGLRRLAAVSELAERLVLYHGDAAELLRTLALPPEVVYLDPMYPQGGKSAAKRKSMRMFRELVGDDADAGALLEAALSVALKRVVVKRPLKAEPLKPKPSAQLKGRTTRFDIYLT